MTSLELTSELLASLVDHLYQEGQDAFRQGHLRESMIWYAQCLEMLKELGDHKGMISTVLYYAGTIYRLSVEHSQALGFFEAVLRLEQGQEIQESTADTLRLVGEGLAEIGYVERARPVLFQAIEMYQALDLPEKGDRARERMDRLGTESGAERPALVLNEQALEFAIRVGEEPVTGLAVEVDATVSWRALGGLTRSVAIGRIHPWNVIWDNPFSLDAIPSL
ncbi:MAG: hypothetical protein JXA37_08395 [Chloroflexia bacterium]|nr:hypothetical protein [Chloroflexia bacterium]